MADSFKFLATKELPVVGTPYANTSDSFVYRVPKPSVERFGVRRDAQAVISSILICNHGSGSASYTIRIIEDGFASPVVFSVDQYVIFHKAIGTNETDVLSLGIGLTTGNALYASTSGSDVNIHVFGTEIL